MKAIQTLMLASMLAMPGLAIAHGDEDHSSSSSAAPGPVKKEQKDWGIAADPQAVKRTLTFKMTDDMRFRPDRIQVKQGETVKLSFRNTGKVMHEFVLGTKKELEEHAALMMKFPNMEHDEPYMVHVAPGKTGQIVWTFNRAGDFDFACLVAGHYEAGMVGKVKVLPSSAPQGSAAASR